MMIEGGMTRRKKATRRAGGGRLSEKSALVTSSH
jgi:hypothetical protein